MTPLWTPSPERAARTELARFMQLVGQDGYEALHRWSVREAPAFWERVWAFGVAPFLIGDAIKIAVAAAALPLAWRLKERGAPKA